MSLNDYIKPLLRWWRLIAMVTLLALAVSTVSTMFQPDNYVSKTTLVVGTTFLDPNPDAGQIMIAQQLARIYADMALREPIQMATMAALEIDWLPFYQSTVVPNTQMLEISVVDTNAERAQIVAIELANQLILQSPTIGDTQTGGQQDFIREQLSSLQNKIQETQQNIEELQKSLEGLTSASQIANLERQISDQTKKLDGLRTNYASFLANSQRGAVNILSVVEPANLPLRPADSKKYMVIVLAGLVGFSVGAGAAYLLEYLDQTIKTTSDVERVFNLPVIGYVSEISDSEGKATYVARSPDSVVAENFRLLQSNIEFYRLSNPVKTILITSPSQGNGKTTVASNLALSISQEEQDVILLDADLRRPAVHRFLKMTKGPGLADAINQKVDIHSVIREWKSEGSLKVITVGVQPSNITEVVGSSRISMILTQLKECHELIIVDAPPLIISDSYKLASRVDGVIIVIEPGQTTNEQARAIKEQLLRANAKIIGIVFNKVLEETANSYGDFRYRSMYSPRYYNDYVSRTTKEVVATSRTKRLTDFFEHGRLPPEVEMGVESAITAIKTQPRNVLSKMRKSKRNGKS